MASLSELLPTGAIRLGLPASDWRGAVRAAGELLAATGCGTDDYTAEMIRNVEENGPYIVVAPGFAFAHARPSPAVLRTGMAWVRLAEPVAFGHESNDPVSLVVALAARDSGAHTAAMAALARLLGDPEAEAALRAASGPEELRTVLERYERATDGGASSRNDGPAPASAADSPSVSAAESGADAPVASAAAASAASAVAPHEGGPRQDAGREGQGAADGPAVHKILTVCGNGVGTSLFLKNTLEQVLARWGWEGHVTVEATDTISAKGKAAEAVAVLTSREIARTLGDVGVPVRVVADFTSVKEVDAVLRDTYDV
ncbi:PTS sugar transporter subunit IIA [Streptomyces albus]|uniref:PTS sugar transporter subunit IIA n=1 Tax=Streptomyces albus TaxID=1888 RepID=UPI003702A914